MTYDTDEYNDAYKININLEDNADNKGKLFSKENLHALLDNPFFLLLYVPENGNKMCIIQPASDTFHRERIIERINEAEGIPLAYYTISHIWGITKGNPHLWEDIGEHVDDTDENPFPPVSMRPEKRGTILELLRDNPDSYWWIDVLCARIDTPLDIIFDIYACGAKSIALIDCEPSVIPQLNSMRNLVGLNTPNLPHENVSENVIFDHYQQLNSLLSEMTVCRRWNHVWTLQEMALPPKVIFMAETSSYKSDPDNMIDIDDLRDFEVILGKILLYLIKIGSRPLQAPSTAFKELRFFRELEMDRKSSFLDLSSLVNLFNLFGQSSRQCWDPTEYVYGVRVLLRLHIPRMTDPNAVWQLFLSELEPVLNELMQNQFTTSKAGVVRFVGINEDAYQINLQDARNMADVYRNFLVVYDCVV